MELPYTDFFSPPAMEVTMSRPANVGIAVYQGETWQMHTKPGNTAENHSLWVLHPSQTPSGVVLLAFAAPGLLSLHQAAAQ